LCKYYDRKSFTDTEISKIINTKKSPINKYKYDIIIFDESQDISLLYFKLAHKIFNDNNNINCNLCILGDKYQSIFDFNGSDNRFIIHADKCFKFNSLLWEKFNLSTSFRVTDEIANFINKCMISNDRIITKKPGIKPDYIICNTFDDKSEKNYIPFQKIKLLLKKYKPDDIFILAPSIKSERTPVRNLENKIKLELVDVPIYVPTNDDEKIDVNIIKNKLLISTFHQTKGLERKIVLIFGFDDSYFKYYKKDNNNNICPNELYVGATRASEHLLLFHHYSMGYLPFLNEKLLKKYTNYENKKNI